MLAGENEINKVSVVAGKSIKRVFGVSLKRKTEIFIVPSVRRMLKKIGTVFLFLPLQRPVRNAWFFKAKKEFSERLQKRYPELEQLQQKNV